tara:strand:+ start:127 stop:642 length:516 start_codon:yes stop_codon:yes gene_type:complete
MVPLEAGFDTFVMNPDNDPTKDVDTDHLFFRPNFSRLLTTLADTKVKLDDIDIISWRGVMTKIMITPYHLQDDWLFNVVRCGQRLHIENRPTKKEKQQFFTRTRRQQLCGYAGYKFEDICTRQDYMQNVGVVDTNEYYCSIYRMRVGSSRLLLAAEIDCYEEVRQCFCRTE